jgi:hypothetical protein
MYRLVAERIGYCGIDYLFIQTSLEILISLEKTKIWCRYQKILLSCVII